MKTKTIYTICKISNWLFPILLFMCIQFFSTNSSLLVYTITIVLGYLAYFFTKNGWRNRMFYEIWIFLGLILAEYILLTEKVTAWEMAFSCDTKDITIYAKVFLSLLCVIILLSKTFTLIYETEEYKSGADKRMELRLDDAVETATYMVEHAQTPQERVERQMKLERAKMQRERYYRNKNSK